MGRSTHRRRRRHVGLTIGLVTGLCVSTVAWPTAPSGAEPVAQAGPGFTTTSSPYGGLIGYFSSYHDDASVVARGGVSWYASVFPVLDAPLESFQLGLGSSWLYPLLTGDTSHYCDAADSWVKEQGYDDLQLFFQTIEGGPGYWVGNKFHSTMAKYMIGETPACYESGLAVATPGWQFGSSIALPMGKTGLVQLSNRVLLPPDGMTFRTVPSARLVGTAWIHMPLDSRRDGTDPVATGDNHWTLFFNTANFKGPVAYFLPQLWSDLSRRDPAIVGKGFDANPLIKHPAMAAEIGQIPLIEATRPAAPGVDTYAKIPTLNFPVDAQGRTVLAQDVRGYDASTFVDAFNAWRSGSGPVPTLGPTGATSLPFNDPDSASLPVRQGAAESEPIVGLDGTVTMSTFDSGASFGFQWASAPRNSTTHLPTYYADTASGRRAVSSVPAGTHLADATFPAPVRERAAYGPPARDWWNIDPQLRVHTARLNDGSTVRYVWMRFVDQPALRRARLTAAERTRLQRVVTRMHETWSTTRNYMAPPSSGTLASFDADLLVTPPPGHEAGYVPVILSQTGYTVPG